MSPKNTISKADKNTETEMQQVTSGIRKTELDEPHPKKKKKKKKEDHLDNCICEGCLTRHVPKRVLEELKEQHMKKNLPLPPCGDCGSRPWLNKRIGMCAACFQLKFIRTERASRKVSSQSSMDDLYIETELLKLSPGLLDLPLNLVHINYLLNKYYGRKQRKVFVAKGIMEVPIKFLIKKLGGLLIIQERKKTILCCKNRIDALIHHLDRLREIIGQPFLLAGSEDSRFQKEDTGIEKNLGNRQMEVNINEPEAFDEPSLPCTNKRKKKRKINSQEGDTGIESNLTKSEHVPEPCQITNGALEDVDGACTKKPKKKRKHDESLSTENLENNVPEADCCSARKDKKKSKKHKEIEIVQLVDSDECDDVEILELEQQSSVFNDTEAHMPYNEPSNESGIKSVIDIIRLEESDEPSVLSTKSKKKKQKKNLDEPETNLQIDSGNRDTSVSTKYKNEHNMSNNNSGTGEPCAKKNLQVPEELPRSYGVERASIVPKRRSLWSVLLEEVGEEEYESANNGNLSSEVVSGTPGASAQLPTPSSTTIEEFPNQNNDDSEVMTQKHNHEASDVNNNSEVEEHAVSRPGTSNSTTENSGMSAPLVSVPDTSSDSDVESILTPRKRKAYSSSAFLDASDEEKLRYTKRPKVVRNSKACIPGPASRKRRVAGPGPASRTLPNPADVHNEKSANPSPSPSKYRRVKKATRNREPPISSEETSDSDSLSDFLVTTSSSSESDSEGSSYDSNASSVTYTSDDSVMRVAGGRGGLDKHEIDEDIEIETASDDDEEVRQAVSASALADRRFQPVVILKRNLDLEVKLKQKKVTSQEWKNLEREREDYEEQTLGSLKFSQHSLDYAIDAITTALNWDVFPFGAKVLNRGRITKRQKKNPNFGEWLEIKQEFIIRHFKTALSITHWRRKWYCCKNRVDKLDFREYLQRFWKIEV